MGNQNSNQEVLDQTDILEDKSNNQDQTNKGSNIQSSTSSPLPKKKASSTIKLAGLSNFILLKQQQAQNAAQTQSLAKSIAHQNNLGEILAQAIMKKYNFRLTLNDLATPLLISIYRKDIKGVKRELKELNKNLEELQFEYEVTLGFWLCIHLEQVNLCNYLIKKVAFLKKIVGSILKKKQENKLISQISRANSRLNSKKSTRNIKDVNFDSDKEENLTGLKIHRLKLLRDEDTQQFNDNQVQHRQDKSTQNKTENSNKTPQFIKIQNSQLQKQLTNLVPEEVQVNTEAAESLFKNFEDITQLIEVKNILRQEFPTFIANLLRIILDRSEEKLAQVLIAYYKASITDDILIKAIANNKFDFLYYMFGFGKNFLYNQKDRTSTQITFVMFFQYIRSQMHDDDEFKETIKDICEWKLQHTGDNFLEALLAFQMDDLAIQFMGSFGNNLNENLLCYCLDTQNQKFIKNALTLKAFDKMLFREDQVVLKLLTYLNDGTRSNYILDVLSLIDISIWKNKHIKELMEILMDFAKQNYEKNKLILSSNPILTIVLACEILKTISKVRKKFENESKRISGTLLRLGEMYLSKISDEKYYEKLILDVDFQNRSVLKIITINSFEKLMDENDPKAENLMYKIWRGGEATNCNGNIFGYSSLSNIVFRDSKRILNTGGRQWGLIDLASNSFEPNFKVDYIIQHRYRSRSIYFYFAKEFFCALVMLIIFQWINYQYLTIVQITNTLVDPEDIVIVNTTLNTSSSLLRQLDEYIIPNYEVDEIQELKDLQKSGSIISNLALASYFFSFGLIFQLVLKLLFNIYSQSQILFDKWTIMDGLSAVLNIIAVQVVKNVTLDYLTNPLMKDTLDYLMIFVLAFSWIRFFMYFLVVRSISKLLLTMIQMVEDTISFIFIVACFLIIMSSIFTTLYQDINPEKFGSLTTTVRTLFDAALAVYSYDNMGGRTLSYSILIVFHVFFSNVLLLNYLIAILSTTYDHMKQSGIFKYKTNLFQYCERFMISFNEKYYGELVLHPPPLSYGCIILLPYLKDKEKMLRVAKTFSHVMYWTESFILIPLFLIYELILLPLAFVKTFLIIVLFLEAGFLRKLMMLLFWFAFGIFIDFYLLYQDCRNLFKILSHTRGFQEGYIKQFQEDNLNINTQIEILNLARDSIISLFKTLKNHFKGELLEKERHKKRSSGKKRSKLSNLPGAKIDSQLDFDDNMSYNASQKERKQSSRKQQNLLNIKNQDEIMEVSSTTSYNFSDESDIEEFQIENELQFLETHAGYNPNDQNCLYVIKKSAILEDWKIRRKIMIENKIHQNQRKNSSKQKNDINNSSGKINDLKNQRAMSLFVLNEENKFINKDDNQDIDEDGDSNIGKGFPSKINKKFESSRKSKLIFLDNLINAKTRMKGSVNNKLPPQQSKTQKLDRRNSKGGEIDYDFEVNPQELKCISQFFSNFVIVSESSILEHIDIVLFLRALPERITHENIHKINLYNFKICQESLIAFQNLELVNAFEYFDDKNRERVQQVKEKLSEQKSQLEQVKDIFAFVKRKMYNHQGLRNHEEDNKIDISSLKRGNTNMQQKSPLSGQPRISPLKQGSSNNVGNNLRILNGLQNSSIFQNSAHQMLQGSRFNSKFMKGDDQHNSPISPLGNLNNDINSQQYEFPQ